MQIQRIKWVLCSICQSHDCDSPVVGKNRRGRKGRGEKRGRLWSGKKKRDCVENQGLSNFNGHVYHVRYCKDAGSDKEGRGCAESKFRSSTYEMLRSLVQAPRVRSQALGRRTLHSAKILNNKRSTCVQICLGLSHLKHRVWKHFENCWVLYTCNITGSTKITQCLSASQNSVLKEVVGTQPSLSSDPIMPDAPHPFIPSLCQRDPSNGQIFTDPSARLAGSSSRGSGFVEECWSSSAGFRSSGWLINIQITEFYFLVLPAQPC